MPLVAVKFGTFLQKLMQVIDLNPPPAMDRAR